MPTPHQREQHDARADEAPHPVDIAASHALPDQHGDRHAEAEAQREDHEHHQIGAGGRRDGSLAEELADPHGIDRSVQRLQDVGGQCGRAKASSVDAIGPWDKSRTPRLPVASDIVFALPTRMPCISSFYE